MNLKRLQEKPSEFETRWDMDATRQLVWDVFGEAQARRAAPSVRSLGDRLAFAQWHYSDVQAILREFISEKLMKRSVIDYVSDGETANDTFSGFMVRISAYVTAFVQTLHALEDIAAHMVYFSLALDSRSQPLKARDINGHRVRKLLSAYPAWKGLHSCLANFDHSNEAKHLDALANLSKHRNIVIPRMTEDFTSETERYQITLSEVKYEDEHFPSVPFSKFATEEFHRASLLVVDLGNELNTVLSGSKPTVV
jgi:hypothetical protein